MSDASPNHPSTPEGAIVKLLAEHRSIADHARTARGFTVAAIRSIDGVLQDAAKVADKVRASAVLRYPQGKGMNMRRELHVRTFSKIILSNPTAEVAQSLETGIGNLRVKFVRQKTCLDFLLGHGFVNPFVGKERNAVVYLGDFASLGEYTNALDLVTRGNTPLRAVILADIDSPADAGQYVHPQYAAALAASNLPLPVFPLASSSAHAVVVWINPSDTTIPANLDPCPPGPLGGRATVLAYATTSPPMWVVEADGGASLRAAAEGQDGALRVPSGLATLVLIQEGRGVTLPGGGNDAASPAASVAKEVLEEAGVHVPVNLFQPIGAPTEFAGHFDVTENQEFLGVNQQFFVKMALPDGASFPRTSPQLLEKIVFAEFVPIMRMFDTNAELLPASASASSAYPGITLRPVDLKPSEFFKKNLVKCIKQAFAPAAGTS